MSAVILPENRGHGLENEILCHKRSAAHMFMFLPSLKYEKIGRDSVNMAKGRMIPRGRCNHSSHKSGERELSCFRAMQTPRPFPADRLFATLHRPQGYTECKRGVSIRHRAVSAERSGFIILGKHLNDTCKRICHAGISNNLHVSQML